MFGNFIHVFTDHYRAMYCNSVFVYVYVNVSIHICTITSSLVQTLHMNPASPDNYQTLIYWNILYKLTSWNYKIVNSPHKFNPWIIKIELSLIQQYHEPMHSQMMLEFIFYGDTYFIYFLDFTRISNYFKSDWKKTRVPTLNLYNC